jgi:hypothetical protein
MGSVHTPVTAPSAPIHRSSQPTGLAMAVNRSAAGNAPAGARVLSRPRRRGDLRLDDHRCRDVSVVVLNDVYQPCSHVPNDVNAASYTSPGSRARA